MRFDGRAFRRGLNKTGRYVRQPSNDKESLALMEEHGVGYSSTGLIARMRQNGNTWQEGVRVFAWSASVYLPASVYAARCL